jgi:hypothetical protein
MLQRRLYDYRNEPELPRVRRCLSAGDDMLQRCLCKYEYGSEQLRAMRQALSIWAAQFKSGLHQRKLRLYLQSWLQ